MLAQGQWADTLLSAERLHLARLGVWSLLSIVAGSAMLAWLRLRRIDSPLLSQFALQQSGWGVLHAIQVLWWRSHLALRDLPSAVQLDRLAWFGAGVDVGLILLGISLTVAGGRDGRRPAFIGVGIGLMLQGAARLLFDARLAALVVR